MVQCRNCGYLHGIARNGATRDDIYFDPDRLRVANLESYAEPNFQVTSHIYLTHVTESKAVDEIDGFGRRHFSSRDFETVRGVNYTWRTCESIRCFRGVWIEPTGSTSPQVPQSQKLHEQIHMARQCNYHYKYIPGLSVYQHSEDEAQNQRLQREEELQHKLAGKGNLIQMIAVGIALLSLVISVVTLLMPRIQRVEVTGPLGVYSLTHTPEPTSTPKPTATHDASAEAP